MQIANFMNEQIKALQKLIRSLEDEQKILETSINNGKQELSNLEVKIDQVTVNIRNKEAKILDLDNSISKKEKELEEISENLTSKNKELNVANNNLDVANSKISELDTYYLEKTNSLRAEFSVKQNEFLDRLEKLQLDTENASKGRLDALKELEKNKDQLELLENKIKEKKSGLKSIEDEIDSVKKTYFDYDNKNIGLGKEIEDKKSTLEELKRLKIDVELEISSLKDLKTQKQKEIQETLVKLEETNESLNEVAKKVSQINAKSEYLDGQRDFIKKQYEKIGLEYQEFE